MNRLEYNFMQLLKRRFTEALVEAAWHKAPYSSLEERAEITLLPEAEKSYNLRKPEKGWDIDLIVKGKVKWTVNLTLKEILGEKPIEPETSSITEEELEKVKEAMKALVVLNS